MKPQYVNSALFGSPPASTFALQVLRDKQKKLELGQRMHNLWERSGKPQRVIADAIGLQHRSYQKALQTGGISYDKVELLAEFHGVDVDWLWTGEAKGSTPDLSQGQSQLDRIERMLQSLLDRLGISEEPVEDVPLKAPAGLTRALEGGQPTPEAQEKAGNESQAQKP